MTGRLKLSFLIEAVDRATAPIVALKARMERMTGPLKQLRAQLGQFAQTRFDQLKASVGQVAERIARMGGLVRIGARWFAATGLAASAATFGVRRVADAVDQLNDRAKQLGITTQRMQELGYAAQLNGSSTEQMAQALEILATNMTDAINGSKEMRVWFERAGIPLERLKRMKVDEVAEAIADKFNEVGDAGQNAEKKLSLLRAVAGRSAGSLKQLLDQGSAGMRTFYAEAHRLGVVLDTDTVRAMVDFNDTFDRMRLTVFGAIARAAREVAPQLGALIERITQWTAANRGLIASKFEAFVAGAIAVIEQLVQRAPEFITSVRETGAALGALARAVQPLGRMFELFDALGVLERFNLVRNGVLALTAAVDKLGQVWERVRRFFDGDGIGRGVERAKDAAATGARAVGGFGMAGSLSLGPPVAAAPPVKREGGATGSWDGKLAISIDGEGRPRVRELRSSSPSMVVDVYTGVQMATP